MLFAPDMAEAIMAGKKWQTRRPADPTNDYSKLIVSERGLKTVVTRKWLGQFCRDTIDGPVVFDDYTDWKVKWQVGRSYAIQSRRGRPAIARYLLLDIRREPAEAISQEDAVAEGFDSPERFFDKLRELYGKDVDLSWPYYALTFELLPYQLPLPPFAEMMAAL
jgi:hypothetical protein